MTDITINTFKDSQVKSFVGMELPVDFSEGTKFPVPFLVFVEDVLNYWKIIINFIQVLAKTFEGSYEIQRD